MEGGDTHGTALVLLHNKVEWISTCWDDVLCFLPKSKLWIRSHQKLRTLSELLGFKQIRVFGLLMVFGSAHILEICSCVFFVLPTSGHRDGQDTASPQLGVFSGNTALESAYSSSPSVLIRFHSDFSTGGFFILNFHGRHTHTHTTLWAYEGKYPGQKLYFKNY